MRSIWDQIVEGECPWDEDQRCPLDCHKGEDYCPEFRRIREVGYRKDEFNKRIQLVQEIILKGECPMYGGKCPEGCYRDDELNNKNVSEENRRCDEYKYAHGIIKNPKHWADVGR
jgi:hypothetical protein